MELKDKFSLIASAAAAAISIITFFLTYVQRRKEDRRATRRALTDVISELNEVNVTFAKLEIESPGSGDELSLNLRRQFSDQRRFYANEAEFVAEQIPKLVTDIDALTIAHAFMSIRDYERAEKFFKLAVAKARTDTIQLVSRRNLAQFYFRKGNVPAGRKVFEEALKVKLPDDDAARESVASLYLFWAREEKRAGFLTESEAVNRLAKENAERIGIEAMRLTTLNQIMQGAD